MVLTVEFEDDAVRAWRLTEDGAESVLDETYAPSISVEAPADALDPLRERLAADPKVCGTALEERFTSLHAAHVDEPTTVLRVDAERVGELRTLADEIRRHHARELDGARAPGAVRLYDVDLAPGFRYCLDEGLDPTPARSLERDLRTLRIAIDEPALAAGDVSTLRVDGDRVRGDPRDVCWSLGRRLERADPDVLVLSHADLVPTLHRAATDAGLEGFHLGRLPGWTRLAGENTFESYGRVGHSPARYRVPGRAIVDESNSFLWHQSDLHGLLYMVERTGRPLQEAAWGSIGTLLTSRQIRLAREEGVLAPLNKWEPERFKRAETLHAADRGGFTFAPEVGFHEDVHEIDFASLYPRIICRHNVSPETVDCACVADGGAGAAAGGEGAPGEDGAPALAGRDTVERVPELEYRICPREGFLPRVLDPLLRDRAERKRRLRDGGLEAETAARCRAESGAIKWVLVSCFGYQGYRNAKFGRIECHEAINAYARDILLRAKARLEVAGWHVVHGIVDSLWVTARAADPEPLEDVIAEIGRDVAIPLECDGSYEWVCFVPRRDARDRGEPAGTGTRSSAPAGALTKYFGKRESGEYKLCGIEARQRSTPAFVADCQRDLLDALDRERDPAAVCDRLERHLGALRRGAVDPAALVITTRASRPLEAYDGETRTVAALRRYEARGMTRRPGQSVQYVVVDDDASRTRERVRLDFEVADSSTSEPPYDADFYEALLIRACESVTSPLGWDRTAIRRHLAAGRPVGLSAFRSS